MLTRKTTVFYVLLSAVLSFAVALVIASRLDLTPSSAAQSLSMPAMNSAPVTGALDAQTFRNVAKAESPMVVNIRTEMRQRTQDLQDFFGGGQGGSPDDFLHRFFGQPGDPGDAPQAPRGRAPGQGNGRQPREETTVAAGTGFIINKDGLILTNNHVIDGAVKIQVTLFGEEDQQYDAKLVGRDQLADSALIQLTEKPNHPLPEAKFGDSSQMAAGDWVMAIGNPFSKGWTVTVGVISAVQRPFDVTDRRNIEMIQTDAAINPGNSGGPLLNLRGEVIGMNTAIISNGGTEGNIGIGFAVPINTVRDLLPQLSTGKVTRGRIGVEVGTVPREALDDFGLKSRTGALVSSVSAGGAAEKGGLRPGDVIIEYNGQAVPNTSDLVKMVTATKPGTSVAVKVMRDKKEQTLHVTVDELDLQAEQGTRQSRNDNSVQPPEQQDSDSFGLTLSNITPPIARRLQMPSGRTGALISDVDSNGPSAGVLRQGDVILQVNRQTVSSAADAGRELQRIASGRFAQILVWRDGAETFVTVKKD